ncbi:hypothetical protein ACP6M3_30600, partial [Pseudomonas aeruginosa]
TVACTCSWSLDVTTGGETEHAGDGGPPTAAARRRSCRTRTTRTTRSSAQPLDAIGGCQRRSGRLDSSGPGQQRGARSR